MSLCLDKVFKTDWGEAVSAEPRSVFFIGFFPVLSSHPGMANKIVRLVQYEGNKCWQCGPLTTNDGQD